MKDSGGSVYLIGCAELRALKIGVARNPATRLAKLQAGCPAELELIAMRDGGYAYEGMLHTRYAALKIRGEWFRDAPEIRAEFAGCAIPTNEWTEGEWADLLAEADRIGA